MIFLIQHFGADFPQESQPQNHEFRNNPENFHPCMYASEQPVEGYSQWKSEKLLWSS